MMGGIQSATFSASDWCRATRQTPPPDTPPRQRPAPGRWGCKPAPVGSARKEKKQQHWHKERRTAAVDLRGRGLTRHLFAFVGDAAAVLQGGDQRPDGGRASAARKHPGSEIKS